MAESEDSFMVDSPQELLKDATPGYFDVQSFVPATAHVAPGTWCCPLTMKLMQPRSNTRLK